MASSQRPNLAILCPTFSPLSIDFQSCTRTASASVCHDKSLLISCHALSDIISETDSKSQACICVVWVTFWCSFFFFISCFLHFWRETNLKVSMSVFVLLFSSHSTGPRRDVWSGMNQCSHLLSNNWCSFYTASCAGRLYYHWSVVSIFSDITIHTSNSLQCQNYHKSIKSSNFSISSCSKEI